MMDSPGKPVRSDARFDDHFRGRLIQIFLYVTDECNIRCEQCYYKPWLKKGHAELPTDAAVGLLRKFHELGAAKVTFLGGEPTLYGRMPGNEPLSHLVATAKDIGFEYTRIVSNGLFDPLLLLDPRMQSLSEITFSFDSDQAAIHNKLRGKGTFERALENLQHAVARGYTAHLTMCAHRGNIGHMPDGSLILSNAVNWAASLGVRSFNIHPLLRMGVPRDSWTGKTNIEPDEWLAVYKEISAAIRSRQYLIPVRIPMRFATISKFEKAPEFYGYCSVKRADRLDIHPNGSIHTCALHTGTPVSVANFEDGPEEVSIKWSSVQNEIDHDPYDNKTDHPCAVMKFSPKGEVPLCISLKPGQSEFAWKRQHLDEYHVDAAE